MNFFLNYHRKWLMAALSLSFSVAHSFAQTTVDTNSPATLKIKLIYPELEHDHELRLNVSTHTPLTNLEGTSEFNESVVTRRNAGVYEIVIPLNEKQTLEGVYFSIKELGNGKPFKNMLNPNYPILRNYYGQNGDSVTIKIIRKLSFGTSHMPAENYHITFRGANALKYEIRSQMDSVYEQRGFCTNYFNTDSTFNVCNDDEILAQKLFANLSPYAKSMDVKAFGELKIHALYQVKTNEALLIRTAVREKFQRASLKTRLRLAESLEVADSIQWSSFKREDLINSYDFGASEVEKYYAILQLKSQNALIDSIPGCISGIKDMAIKEHVALLSAAKYSNLIFNYQTFLQRISALVYTNEGREQLKDLNRITVGQPAYDFSLTDVNGKQVNLAQFKGKVIFLDFWFTGCGNCTNYFTNVVSGVEKEFRNRPDVVFITVSIDRNRGQWLKSVGEAKYSSPFATNLYTGGKGMSADVIEHYRIVSFPTPLIIDKNHRIFKMSDSLRDKETLINALNLAVK